MPQTNPNTFKERIIQKYPNDVASDGRRYADIPARELTQKFVDKYPDDMTSDGIPYKAFLGTSYQPENNEERNYFKEALKLYDKWATEPTKKGMDAASKFLQDVSPNKTLSYLGTTLYANSKGARKMQEESDAGYSEMMDKIRAKIRDPQTSVEQKKHFATLANTMAPPNIIESALGDTSTRKVAFGAAEDILNTVLLKGLSGGGLSAFSRGAGGKEIVKETTKSAAKYGALEFGETVAEGMGENKPLDTILKDSAKEGATLAGITGVIEAGVPGLSRGAGAISKVFGGVLKKIKGSGGDVSKLEQDLALVAEGVERRSPGNAAVGDEVVDTLSLQNQAARNEAEQNIKNTSTLLENQYTNPALNPRAAGTRLVTKIDDYKKNEKEIADNFWGDSFLGVARGETTSFSAALDSMRAKFENVLAWDSFKNSLGRLAGKTDEALSEAVGGVDKDVLKSVGITLDKDMTVNEMILSERGIRDMIGAESKAGYKAPAAFYAELSDALKKDILETLSKTNPEKAQAYVDEITRYRTFKDNLSQVKQVEWSKDPLGTVLNMTDKEIETLYGLSTFKDDIAETQESLINYIITTSKENGVVNVSKLEDMINRAAKNNSVSTTDLANLSEFKDLHVVLQGGGRNATEDQSSRLLKMLGNDYEKTRESARKSAEAQRAFEQAGGTGNIDEIKLSSDRVVDRIVKLKSAREFDNIWSRLTPEQQKSVSARAVANAFSDGFVVSGGAMDYTKMSSYLEGIGFGSGNKAAISTKLFDENTTEVLGKVYEMSQEVATGANKTNRVAQLLHTLLGLGHVASGSKQSAAYHFASAYNLQKTGVKFDENPADLLDTMMGGTDDTRDIYFGALSSDEFKKAEGGLMTLLGEATKKGAVANFTYEELERGAQEMLGRPLTEEEKAELSEQEK